MSSLEKLLCMFLLCCSRSKAVQTEICVGFVMKRAAARRIRKQKLLGVKFAFEFIIYVKLKLNNFVPEGVGRIRMNFNFPLFGVINGAFESI